jgi:hypothetical protein
VKKTLFVLALGFGPLAAQLGHAVVIDAAGDELTAYWLFLGAGASDNDGGAASLIDLSTTGLFNLESLMR